MHALLNSSEYISSKIVFSFLQRDACVEDAKKSEGITAKNAKDIVTDNFLCSGGIEPTVDDIACKGEFGFTQGNIIFGSNLP